MYGSIGSGIMQVRLRPDPTYGETLLPPELLEACVAAAADAVDAVRGGVRLVVVLVVVLGRPERGCGLNLREDALEAAGLLERLLRLFGSRALGLVGDEDNRTVLRSHIAELPRTARRVGIVPVRVEQGGVADLRGGVD